MVDGWGCGADSPSSIVRMARIRRRQTVDAAQRRRDPDRPANVGPDTHGTAVGSDQGGLAAAAAAGDEVPVQGVDALAKDVIEGVGHLPFLVSGCECRLGLEEGCFRMWVRLTMRDWGMFVFT